jgi:hypothetical protein
MTIWDYLGLQYQSRPRKMAVRDGWQGQLFAMAVRDICPKLLLAVAVSDSCRGYCYL